MSVLAALTHMQAYTAFENQDGLDEGAVAISPVASKQEAKEPLLEGSCMASIMLNKLHACLRAC